ncbi:MAG: S8 family serine peptidase, partial [Clostridiaceae bacterium]|nr:S8 family serine peptidase [Clostridiaceae bacterium]
MYKKGLYKSLVSILIVITFLFSSFMASVVAKPVVIEKNSNNKRIIVKFNDLDETGSITDSVKKSLKLSKLIEKKELKSKKMYVYEISENDRIESVIKEFKKNKQVEYVQEDYLLQTFDVPADTRFNEQWCLDNNGQTINGQVGINGVDINILQAWEKTKGSEDVLVGIVDTGVDILHNELIDNIYINTDEIPDNGIDDDLDGYIDNVKGWDFVNNDNTVYDSEELDRHGTHVAGIVSAEENGEGVCGVSPSINILPVKVLSGNTGYTSDILEGISYCENMGVDIVNFSFGGIEENLILKEAMSSSSMLFLCAAGNMGTDSTDIYPASYDLPNIISVAALDNRGELAAFSNYGNKVDVAAPGVGILSTMPENTYGFLSGTSMSTPVVSGIIGLLKSYIPDITVDEMVRRIKQNVVVSTKLNGKVSSGGRVDAGAVINDVVPQPEESTYTIIDSRKNIQKIIDAPSNNTLYGNGKTNTTLIVDDSNCERRQVRPQDIGVTTVSENVYVQSTLTLSDIEPNNSSSEATPVGYG